MNDNKVMNRAADNIRILAAAMVEKAKSGHPGGAMGGADFINTLYSEFLVYDPENPAWEGRDRFFLDPGHMADIRPEYIGKVIPNHFVIGYGLDYDEKYRNLPYIGILRPEIYAR